MKVLVLPGFMQGAGTFAIHTAALKEEMERLGWHADYLSPYHAFSSMDQVPYRYAGKEELGKRWNKLVARNNHRYWWLHDEEKGEYRGFDESLAFFRQYLRENGPYDGIVGFSQGAAMATVLATQAEELNGQQFQFALLFSGLVPTESAVEGKSRFELNELEDLDEFMRLTRVVPSIDAYFDGSRLDTKVVCIYGTKDTVVTPIRTRHLATRFQHVLVVKHDGAHVVVSDRAQIKSILRLVGPQAHL